MNLLEPCAIEDLGAGYKTWETAPAGAVLAFGGRTATGSGTDWKQGSGQAIAIRAESSGNPVLVLVAPEVKLCFAKIPQSVFGIASAAMGPAVDISKTHRLAIANLAPEVEDYKHVAGSVLMKGGTGDIYLAVDYPDYANRGLCLKGQDAWKVTDMPTEGLLRIGKPVVIRRNASTV